jgi:hypothetical protein
MKRFEIKGYLTESRLAEVILELAPEGFVREFKLTGRGGYRWDFKYVSTDGTTTLVEYDGDEHYRNTLVIRADRAKTRIATEAGFRLIRFPYWLQLDSFTLRHVFGFEAEIVQNFPHGFITTKLFPGSFCPMGLVRFESEFDALPESLKVAVGRSLMDRAAEYGDEYVASVEIWNRLKR